MDDRTAADVVVLGMGPGGEDAAGRLADAGLDVVGVEARLVGGECPYWGCVPSKMMVRAGDLLAEARRVPGMAGDAQVTADWGPVAARIRRDATDGWDDRVAAERFEGRGGRLVRGRGRLLGPRQVRVGDQVIDARRGIVVATGTRPAVPPVTGLDEVPYWTNRQAVEATDLPGSLVVLGGGAVGAELAQVFARFGVEVTVVELADRLLPGDEPEAGEVLAGVFEREGVAVRTATAVARVRLRAGAAGADGGGGIAVELDGGGELTAERLLVATGRRADLRALGADTLGLDPDERWLPVDGHMRVADGVWAVGDVTGKGAFTHVAVHQAPIAVADILGEEHPPASYRAVPRVTFTDPEVGAVGLTEAQARQAGLAVRTGSAQVAATARGWIHGAGNDGVVKLVEDRDRGVLVGATAAGPAGGEVLGLLSLAVHAEVPTRDLRTMILAYPTFHRAIGDALADLDG